LKVCLTCIEFFGDSIYGGFGRSTRFIGAELAKRGIEVSVVVPRRAPDRPDFYEMDGIRVHQFSPHRLDKAAALLRTIDDDVYHSQDTSILAPLARIAAPRAAHVLTFRDPMDRHDWNIETAYAGMGPFGWRLYRWFITNPFISWGVHSMDARYCAAEFLIPKTRLLYNLPEAPDFLPSPVHMPASVRKNEKPTVCYIGRWEGRKRVELFFELAKQHGDVEFIALGGNRDPARDGELRRRYAGIPNLKMPGVIDQFTDPAWSEVLGKSWVLINTSLREGLPTTFIEAAAHKTSILSFTDPDGFASRFGRCAGSEGLSKSLNWLLEDSRWRKLGEAGRAFVEKSFAIEPAIESHMAAYSFAIAQARQRSKK
jgi:glycosyltransferase involved in cell wall biosynthesis